MENIFIPYELAKELKELGFEEDGLAIYTNTKKFLLKDISQKEADLYFGGYVIPTWEQAFQFFRDNYKLFSHIEPVLVEEAKSPIKFDYLILSLDEDEEDYNNLPYHTYPEAREECLRKLIQIVKDDTARNTAT